MKKVCWIAALFLVAGSVDAQKVSLGLKASPGIAWIKPDTKGVQGDGSLLGFAYGAIFDYLFTENYGLGSGLFIYHQGGKLEQTVDSNLVSVKYKLQYVNIPLTLKMRTNEIGYFRYFGQFGVMPGVNLGAKGTVEIPGAKIELEDPKDDINTLNVALVIGLGTMYNFSGNTSLVLGIEWNNGFTDVFKGSDIKGKNNFLLVNAGVVF
jgi:hypothetical protein